jgi:integrase
LQEVSRTAPRQKYEEAKEGFSRAVESGSASEADADATFELCAAYDEEDMRVPLPSDGEYAEDTTHKEPNTLRYWCVHLKRIAERMDVRLIDATADDINELMTAMQKGDHQAVSDEGLANNSIRNYQGVARRFYRYHEDLGVEPEDIPLISGDDTHVDDRDMLTSDEIDRIRSAAEHPRDLAIFDLLLYTGQRNTAIRSLRIRDIDFDENVYYLNEEADGLKRADETGSKRPLLGAVSSIREWLRYHPDSDNPNAYLITGKPRYTDTDPETMVSKNTLGYAMKELKKKVDIDKPMNPHNIRHNFVTICKREYGLSDATIKHLIGHRPDSQVMETTYAHLSDEDFIQAAEVGAGISEPEDESTLSPNICQTCGEPLAPDAKACPGCGTVYTPDAKAVKERMEDDIKQSYVQSDPENDKVEKIEKIDELLSDPEIRQLLLDQASK